MTERLCLNCGKELKTQQKKYCSRRCRNVIEGPQPLEIDLANLNGVEEWLESDGRCQEAQTT